MARCEVCGNDYDKAFVVERQGDRFVFDSLECAIHRLAPPCAHCGCKVIGTASKLTARSTAARTAPGRRLAGIERPTGSRRRPEARASIPRATTTPASSPAAARDGCGSGPRRETTDASQAR
jgi:hypothetical protein